MLSASGKVFHMLVGLFHVAAGLLLHSGCVNAVLIVLRHATALVTLQVVQLVYYRLVACMFSMGVA